MQLRIDFPNPTKFTSAIMADVSRHSIVINLQYYRNGVIALSATNNNYSPITKRDRSGEFLCEILRTRRGGDRRFYFSRHYQNYTLILLYT